MHRSTFPSGKSVNPAINLLSFLPINFDHITDSQRWDIHPFLQLDFPTDPTQTLKENSILLQPPLLYEERDGSYEILSGRRRIRAAREIYSLTECTCLVAPLATPPHTLLSLLFESHRLSSALSPMEMANFFNIGRQYLSLKELAHFFLPKAPEKNGIKILREYLQLLSLEKEIQQLVHSLFIAESMALDLLKLNSEDRIGLSRLFWDFQLGGGKQRRLFILLRDICARNSTTFSVFIEQPEITDILHHKEMNNPQKIQRLLSLLQQISAPSHHQEEDAFKSQINRLKLPPSCGVQHAQAFETDEVTLTIRFSNLESLINSWPRIYGALTSKRPDQDR